MTNHDRVRLIFHGAIVLLIGLLCGLPTTLESINESARLAVENSDLDLPGQRLLPTGPAASTFEFVAAAGAADPHSNSAIR